jgi:hypothetical protein
LERKGEGVVEEALAIAESSFPIELGDPELASEP